ncbi:MAG: hypothetical protein WCH34_18705 [Bacteroidota bacterium]
MKNLMLAYAMLAVAAENSSYGVREFSKSEYVKDLQEQEEKQMLSKGLKKFYFGDNFVWSINQKNADRKARSLNWL